MRNITLSHYQSFYFNLLETCEGFCCNEDYMFVYSKDSLNVYKRDGQGNLLTSYNLLKLENVTFKDDNGLVDMTYSSDKNCLHMFFRRGEIFFLKLFEELDKSAVIGEIENGILAAEWSPEQELIAIVSGNFTVLILTNRFEKLCEVDLHSRNFGEKEFINVGWGKKETQFRGTEGKFKDKIESSIEEDIDEKDEGKVTITWRGDADYFAVSCINPETLHRYLRIFDRDGTLQYTSEDIVGLEESLSWRPSGNLIASTQRLPNKYNVCFIEKNGLKHGEFTLPFSFNKVCVENILWSHDSKLLALHIEEVCDPSVFQNTLNTNQVSKVELSEEGNCDDCNCKSKQLFNEVEEKGNASFIQHSKNLLQKGKKFIQIYTMQNYHWYCKYTIEFLCDEEILFLNWDERKTNSMYIISKKHNIIHFNEYSWLWVVNKSKGYDAANESWVGVIDGCNILLTSFVRGIIPPPMCTYKLELPTFAIAVGFTYSGEKVGALKCNDIFVQLSNGSVLAYEFKLENENSFKFEQSFQLISADDNGRILYYNILRLSTESFVFCKAVRKTPNNRLVPFLSLIKVSNVKGEINFVETDLAIRGTVAIIKPFSEQQILIYDNSGEFYSYRIDNENDDGENALSFLASTTDSITDIEVAKKKDGNILIFSLDKSNRFYVDYKCVAYNITSFHIHEEFLLLTTLKQQLLCLNIETEMSKMFDGCNLPDIFQRKIERGSRLITSVLKDSKVILQMPRGNLECIQPRALSLVVIGKYLDNLEYQKAFDVMRKQRINLNLLYDYNPDDFVKNITTFIEKVEDPSWLSLFLSELVPEDVTETMYSVVYNRRNNYNKKNNDVNNMADSKISNICELMEKTLSRRSDANKYILPILTTYIKRNTVEFTEMALLKIKETKEREAKDAKLPVSASEAFKYLLYLIDVEELYKVALGMYDFDLALFVANRSQKDPKEYLSFLNELKKLETNYRRFVIDKFLKRYEKALNNLILCDGDEYFSELMSFVKTHKLYRPALKLIPHTTDRYKQICSSYAEELMEGRYFEEAGIMFSNSGSYHSAVKAYTKSGNWEEVTFCVRQLNLRPIELNEIFHNLASELIDAKLFKEASIIYLDYLKNLEACLTTLCLGRKFAEAFRLADLHNRNDIIQTQIRPGILEYYKIMKIQISMNHQQYLSQKNRLSIVRLKKQKEQEQESEMENTYLDQSDGDLYSEASTVVTQSHTSRSTARTFRSSKNRRKQERKLLSLKEGSPFEDLALVIALHKIVTSSYGLRQEVKDLNLMLIKIHEEESAANLQNLLGYLLKEIENSKSEVWIPELISTKPSYGPDSTSNEIAAMHMRQETTNLTNLLPCEYMFPPIVSDYIKWKLEILS